MRRWKRWTWSLPYSLKQSTITAWVMGGKSGVVYFKLCIFGTPRSLFRIRNQPLAMAQNPRLDEDWSASAHLLPLLTVYKAACCNRGPASFYLCPWVVLIHKDLTLANDLLWPTRQCATRKDLKNAYTWRAFSCCSWDPCHCCHGKKPPLAYWMTSGPMR